MKERKPFCNYASERSGQIKRFLLLSITSLLNASYFVFLVFSNTSYLNNVALLQLENEFVLNDQVNPICLPNHATVLSNVDVNSCVAAGWGGDQNGKSIECMFISVTRWLDYL